MRYAFLICLAIAATACKKQNTIQFPLHESSTDWLQQSLPRTFVSNLGDTLLTQGASLQRYWLSDLVDDDPNSGFEDFEIVQQDVVLDSLTRLRTVIKSVLKEPGFERKDEVSISLTYKTADAQMNGVAWPAMQLNLQSCYYSGF